MRRTSKKKTPGTNPQGKKKERTVIPGCGNCPCYNVDGDSSRKGGGVGRLRERKGFYLSEKKRKKGKPSLVKRKGHKRMKGKKEERFSKILKLCSEKGPREFDPRGRGGKKRGKKVITMVVFFKGKRRS